MKDTIAKAVFKRHGGAPQIPVGTSTVVASSRPAGQEPEATGSSRQVEADLVRSGHGEISRVPMDMELLVKLGIIMEDGLDRHTQIEEFRHIKRPLLAHVDGKGAAPLPHANLIMVSSSLPGEGKTFTTLNLALSIAREQDRTVMLIDADVAKPHISRLLGLQERPGLIDLLGHDRLSVPEVIVKTEIPNLSVIPAGRRHAHTHTTEMLASERMRELATELANRYVNRIVLFDSPPLLITSESHVLAALMDQIVLVVEEGRTAQSAVQKSIDMLNRDQIIGLVLNKSRHRAGGSYYGGRGYYRYGA